MKIKITKEAKQWLTVAEMPAARQIIELYKDDNLIDWCKMAINIVCPFGGFEILKASAEIAGNRRVHDIHLEGSGRLDVWIEFYAFEEYNGFYTVGAYLSDIWQSRCDGENHEYLRNQMLITHYTKDK